MLKMNAAGDTYKGRIFFTQIRFIGKGLTLGEQLTLTDINGGLLTEHYVTALDEDIVVLGPGDHDSSNGAIVAAIPSGTAEVQIHLI